jgi:hypothetical protein
MEELTKYKIQNSEDFVCKKLECSLKINNDFLIGNDRADVDKALDTHAFSFGTHFIPVDEEGNVLIASGHIKISSRSIRGSVFYNRDSKPVKVQTKLYNILTSLFGYKFKQNQSSFEDCASGYSYLGYFIKYDKKANTYHISDFFVTADMRDKYHFSLLNSFGIMNIGEHTYITSGEGDFYNSILKFNTKDILNWCRYDALSKDFNINNINYLLLLKDTNGEMNNIIIDDDTITEKVVRYFTGIPDISIGNPYIGLSFKNTWEKKYLKYKSKYTLLKQKKLKY